MIVVITTVRKMGAGHFPTYYTVKKSAVVVALGFAGLLCFVTAYMSIAVQIAKAIGDKAVLVK